MPGIRTFAIIKPDAVAAGHDHSIRHRIRTEGFVVRAEIRGTLSALDVRVLYQEHTDKPFFADLCVFMVSGPSIVMVLERADAAAHWRSVLGPADSRMAPEGSLRWYFGDKTGGAIYRNVAHGSDSDAAAEREIAIFFGPQDQLRAWLNTPPGAPAPEDGRAFWSDGFGPRTPGPPMLRQDSMAALIAEVDRARAKFPTSGRFRLAALVEEVGELANALAPRVSDRNREAVREEALQVAATAMRLYEEGDGTEYQIDALIQLVVATGKCARYLLQRRPKDLDFALRVAENTAARMIGTGDKTFDDITDEEAQP